MKELTKILGKKQLKYRSKGDTELDIAWNQIDENTAKELAGK